jgi:hypothetical protein
MSDGREPRRLNLCGHHSNWIVGTLAQTTREGRDVARTVQDTSAPALDLEDGAITLIASGARHPGNSGQGRRASSVLRSVMASWCVFAFNQPSSNEMDKGLGASSAPVVAGQKRPLLLSTPW